MKKRFRIIHDGGIHARPATLLVKTASAYKSEITLSKNGSVADAKSIIDVLTLAAAKGEKLEISLSGDDAEQALQGIESAMADIMVPD